MAGTRATTIRFSGPIYERLERASKYTGLPINAIVTAACMEWLRDQFPAAIDVGAQGAPSAVGARGPATATTGAARWPMITSDAQAAMTSAEREALRLNHHHVGTEHLLAGIAAHAESVSAQALAQVGIDVERIRQAIEFIVGLGSAPKTGRPRLTPRAQRAVEWAADEARRRGDPEVDSGHLLLGLCEESDGLAMRIAEHLGSDADSIRAAVRTAMGDD